MCSNSEELELIRAVQNCSDSAALESLLIKYRPMINLAMSKFYLRDFDRDDWLQEARIVCYETCLLYETNHNCQFSSFFRLRLYNHLRNILRHELATKRLSNQMCNSLDEMLIQESEATFRHPFATEPVIVQQLNLNRYLTSLSYLELQAFQVMVNQKKAAEVCELLDCTEKQLARAVERCHQKLKLHLIQENREWPHTPLDKRY